MGRTNEEWQYLIKELRKITDNPTESRERRVKAQTILDRIERPHRAPVTKQWQSPLDDLYGFDGTIR
jgi:hypothetical protein